RRLRQLPGRFFPVFRIVLQNGHFDQFPRFQGLAHPADELVADAALADLENRIEMMGERAQVPFLFSRQHEDDPAFSRDGFFSFGFPVSPSVPAPPFPASPEAAPAGPSTAR